MGDIFPNGLDIKEGVDLLAPVALYVIGMSLYAIFIFIFYRFVAKKDIFEFDVSKYEKSKFRYVRMALHSIFYALKYLLLFPIIAFFWFVVLTIMLAVLANEKEFSDILLVSLAVIGTIRICAYFTEDLSKDLAKMLPFAVLGIFIIDVSFFNVSESLNILKQADNHREEIFYYLISLIVLEFSLRLTSAVMGRLIALVKKNGTPTTQEET